MANDGDFVHLHVHSEFSLLDGACKISALLKAAEANGMSSLAITDHGNLHGAVQFYQKATAAGIKPIIGYEAYVAPGSRHEKSGASGIKDAASHLTLLCENDTGYHNLVQLATKASLEGFYYRPRVDKELLAEHSDGLIALSGCLNGEANKLILAEKEKEAFESLARYRDIFGEDNFFLELQNNGMEEQQRCMKAMSGMASELGLKTAATNDIHYISPEDAEAHGVLLCIMTGKTIEDADRMSLSTAEYYFKSYQEMSERFADHPEALTNTAEIARRCNVEMRFDQRHFPRFHLEDTEMKSSDMPAEAGTSDYLRKLCYDGLKESFGDPPPDEAVDRLEYELEVIEQMGYVSYFLIVWDFVKFARDHSIPSGMRGSGVGAMVSYVLGLTDIDPLEYDLLFQRFLDPERKEPPDIDIDLCEEGREKVIKYVVDHYGAANTAQIITFGTMKARAVVRDVGRVLDLPYNEVDRLAKLVPGSLGITLDEALEQNDDLRNEYNRDESVKKLIDISRRLEGLSRHASIHAAGLVIADEPLVKYMPLCETNDTITSQFPMADLEAIGMLKLDFLGVKTLTMMDKCLDLVEARTGERPDLSALPLDDADTYKLLCDGRGKGIFQMSSSGMCGLLQKLQPDCIEDIIAVVALYRPGPLQGGAVDDFIQRKRDPSKVKYLHPMLQPVSEPTYGVIMYQEQIMEVVSKMGGLSMAKSLTLIKAISKKKAGKVEALKSEFIEGAARNGISQQVAEKVYGTIEPFAGYGFNKAHTTAYAFLAYRTAYLKAHYPTEFMAALMTSDMGDTDKLQGHRAECRELGSELLPPDVNSSCEVFTVEDGSIRYSMSALKGVGKGAVEAIVAAREEGGDFSSLFDLCQRVDVKAINKGVLESLANAGAMDVFGKLRSQLFAGIDRALQAGTLAQKDREHKQKSLFDAFGEQDDFRSELEQLPDVPEWSETERLAREKAAVGFYMTSHPLTMHEEMLKLFSSVSIAELGAVEHNSQVVIGGLMSDPSEQTIKKGINAGRQMAKFAFEDLEGSCRCVLFADTYESCGHMLEPDSIVFVLGSVDTKNNPEPEIRVDRIVSFAAARSVLSDHVTVNIPPEHQTGDTIPKLRRIVDRFHGEYTLFFTVPEDGSTTRVRAGVHWRVKVGDEFEAQMQELLGEGCVSYTPSHGPTPLKKSVPDEPETDELIEDAIALQEDAEA